MKAPAGRNNRRQTPGAKSPLLKIPPCANT